MNNQNPNNNFNGAQGNYGAQPLYGQQHGQQQSYTGQLATGAAPVKKKNKLVPIIITAAVVVAIAVIAIIVVSVAGSSSGGGPGSSSGGDSSYTPALQQSGSTSSNTIEPFICIIDGTEYSFPMSISDFESYGWYPSYGYDFMENINSDYYPYNPLANTEDLDFSNVEIYDYSNDNLMLSDLETYLYNPSTDICSYRDLMVSGMQLAEDELYGVTVELPGGIVIGASTFEDCSNIYDTLVSDKYYDDCYHYYLVEHGNVENELVLYFDDDTMVLERAEFRNMIVDTAQFESDTRNDEIDPAFLTIPDSLSDDIFDYAVSINGDLYQLPTAVQAFINNGYDFGDTNTIFTAREVREIEVSYKGRTDTVTVENLKSVAAPLYSCIVTELTMGQKSEVFRDFELSGGFTYGSSVNYMWNDYADGLGHGTFSGDSLTCYDDPSQLPSYEDMICYSAYYRFWTDSQEKITSVDFECAYEDGSIY